MALRCSSLPTPFCATKVTANSWPYNLRGRDNLYWKNNQRKRMAHVFRIVEPSRSVVLFVVAIAVVAHARQAVSCMENEFTCSSQKCIPKDLKCDGENDCGDFSDEINCIYRGKCNPNEFECSDGSCISSTLVCNGKFDCPRGLDETNCDSKTTAPTTPPFEEVGIVYTDEGKVRSFPVFNKALGISLYIRFTAHRCSGNLFQMTSQNTDQLFLLSFTGSGNIEFLFKTSSGPGMVVIPPPPGDSFCNGKRHMLSLRRYLDEFRYRVNRKRSVTKKIGLLREPFSRPFRVYVGTTLEGCVSGFDVIFYRTQYKTYSVGVSKGCAKLKVKTMKTTPSPPGTTASASSLTSQSVRTRMSKESVTQTSPTSSTSMQAVPTEDVSPSTRISQENTLVTQSHHVTHSLLTTLPDSTSGATGFTSQGVHSQSSSEVTQLPSTRAQTPSVTQSDDILDPFFIGEGESTLPSLTNLVTSPTTYGPKGTTGSKFVMHSSSSSKVDSMIITTGRDAEDGTKSATRDSMFRTTEKLLKYVTHSPSTTDSATATQKHSSEGRTPSASSNSKIQTATRKLSKLETCEPLRSKFCAYMGYNQTRLPGEEGFRDQLQAEKQMSRFLPFIRANCSRFLRDFICASHLPPCSSPHSPTVHPCRELCLKSKQECNSLMKAFEFDWPEYLDCRKFPSSENGKCVEAHDTKGPVVPTPATHLNRKPGCGGILTRSSGIIKTPDFPNPYPANALCKWYIILPKVYHVVDIILEEVSLEADVNCGYDYLLFLDGLSNQVGPRICGFLPYPRVITVKGNMASIVFRSDSALNKKGVLIKYTAHCPFLSCSGDDVTLVTQY